MLSSVWCSASVGGLRGLLPRRGELEAIPPWRLKAVAGGARAALQGLIRAGPGQARGAGAPLRPRVCAPPATWVHHGRDRGSARPRDRTAVFGRNHRFVAGCGGISRLGGHGRWWISRRRRLRRLGPS